MSISAQLAGSALAMQKAVQLRVPDHPVSWKAETDSTNEDARRGALGGAAAGAVFGAEFQTGGRGRLTRRWNSGAGEAVEISLLFRPQISLLQPAGFSFAAALGIAQAAHETADVDAKIKWPNDVVVDGKKICGILCEAATLGAQAAFMIVGAGTNVNQDTFPAEIAQRAASLRMLTGRSLDRADVAAACIRHVSHWTERFLRNGLPALMDAYCERSAVLERDVEVYGTAQIYAGRCTGFAPDGAILVEGPEGVRSFHANDISLRGAGLHV